MREDVNKLIRDRIPELMEQRGQAFELATMSDEEYRRALLDKLVEEANEAVAAAPEDLVKELADVHEVIDAIVAAFAVDRELLNEEQSRRRAERGAFEKKLRLLWVSQ